MQSTLVKENGSTNTWPFIREECAYPPCFGDLFCALEGLIYKRLDIKT